MNYEKFNDAMCKLRQAEEDFNKALQDVAVAINENERRQQKVWENNDKDLNEALHILAAEDGMSVSELSDAFGICSVCDILLEFTPEEIIDKTVEWKTKQKKEEKEDQELHIGDEVTIDNDLIGIITDVDDGNNGIVWVTYRLTSEARGFDFCWAYRAKCKKTGRHFDSIPFDYNSKKR